LHMTIQFLVDQIGYIARNRYAISVISFLHCNMNRKERLTIIANYYYGITCYYYYY